MTKFVENGLACTTRRIKPPKKLRKLQERNVKEKLVNNLVETYVGENSVNILTKKVTPKVEKKKNCHLGQWKKIRKPSVP